MRARHRGRDPWDTAWHNDEVLERIYIGRRFKNDSERLEKLFDLYTKMTAAKYKPGMSAKENKA